MYTDGGGVCNPRIGGCWSSLSNHLILVDDTLYKLLFVDDPEASLEGVSLATVFPRQPQHGNVTQSQVQSDFKSHNFTKRHGNLPRHAAQHSP